MGLPAYRDVNPAAMDAPRSSANQLSTDVTAVIFTERLPKFTVTVEPLVVTPVTVPTTLKGSVLVVPSEATAAADTV